MIIFLVVKWIVKVVILDSDGILKLLMEIVIFGVMVFVIGFVG